MSPPSALMSFTPHYLRLRMLRRVTDSSRRSSARTELVDDAMPAPNLHPRPTQHVWTVLPRHARYPGVSCCPEREGYKAALPTARGVVDAGEVGVGEAWAAAYSGRSASRDAREAM